MNRRIAIALLVGASAWIPAHAADPLPSAESILDRYVEVTGGKAAYERRKTEIMKGSLEYTALGVKGAVTRYSAEPDSYYATLEIEGLGKVEMGVNNGVAWENSAVLGPRIKSGTERTEAIREGTLNADLLWRKLFQKAETAGVETLDGQECYKVVLTPAEGRPETMYFQRKSGLAVRITTVTQTQMGEIPVEVNVSGYKDFGGVLAPAKTTQKAAGQEFTITIDSVQVNAPVPKDRFDLPAEVKALAAKAQSN